MLAPLIALNKASEYVRPIPITSPVDFISGPRAISTRPILEKENTGAFTATYGLLGTRPSGKPKSFKLSPRAMRVAYSTILMPVTLEMNGTVRLERGLTSITLSSPSATIYWMLSTPLTLRPTAIRRV